MDSSNPKWYILISSDLNWAENQLIQLNTTRHKEGLQTMQYFIPFSLLKNQSYAVLRHYIFVFAERKYLADFQRQSNYQTEGKYIWFYRDRHKREITVPEKVMHNFIATCTDYNERIELSDDARLMLNKEIRLNTTPFKGEKARIIEIRHTQEGVRMTLGLTLASGSIVLKIKDIKEGDITYINNEERIMDVKHLTEQVQHQLHQTLSCRIYGKSTQASLREDVVTINTLSNYRYHKIEDTCENLHFQSLMLICAHLAKNQVWEDQIKEQLEEYLTNNDSEINIESRCWYLVAMYITTGNPEYRNKAKRITQEYPITEELRRYVRLIRKKKIK